LAETTRRNSRTISESSRRDCGSSRGAPRTY
jgi:hypothetical protein